MNLTEKMFAECPVEIEVASLKEESWESEL